MQTTAAEDSAQYLERDYVKIAKDYATRAAKDKAHKRHGQWTRLACVRFLEDLKRAEKKDNPFYFDPGEAADPCDFIEKLPHVEGTWPDPFILLDDWQVWFTVNLFGFRDSKTGLRRFTVALLAVARKNAKSTWAAGIVLYCFCCEDEPGAQIKTAATTFGQAAIVFNIAKKMIQKDVQLRQEFGLDTWASSITRVSIGGSVMPIHAKASTQDGLNPSMVTLDEIHAHKTADLQNVLSSAMGARACPLTLLTTTEGYSNPGPWPDLRLFTKQLLEGVFGTTADHFLGVIYALDPGDNDFKEQNWIKANPLIESNPYLLPAIKKDAVEAKQMPGKLAEFKIKHLNKPAAQAEGFIDLEKFQACDGEVILEDLVDVPCWGGLDLAQNRDITAFRAVWIVDGVIYTKGWRWVPESAVAYRTERGTVPYQSWVEQKLIKQTPGEVTDFEIVGADILEVVRRFNFRAIAYDPWNSSTVVANLEGAVTMSPFRQGAKSYHPALQKFELHYIGGKLRHEGDPVLTWCASNFMVRRDANMNMAPSKRASAEKIDDLVALVMAIGITETEAVHDNSFLKDPIIAGR